uniref:7TM_GPCR_Srx domain-containing protein n=1 Tax=Caenorhabditis tropicalis TaxID=1561998 RepID=A0A1I7T8Z5_9PELO
MNDIFVYGGVKNIPLYNCSARTSEQWSTETGEKHPVIGYLQIVYGLIVDKLQVFIQSALICGASQIAAIIYVIMNLTTVFPAIIIFGHVLWQIVHGAPVLIYITLNDMIRKRFFEIIRFRKVNATTVISEVNPSTVVVI